MRRPSPPRRRAGRREGRAVDTMRYVGARIAAIRKRRGLTQEALAARIGTALKTAAAWLRHCRALTKQRMRDNVETLNNLLQTNNLLAKRQSTPTQRGSRA